MDPKKFEIKFLYNPTAAYLPGDTIEGTLIIVADQEIKTKGINLTFQGKAKVYWTEKEGQLSKDDRGKKVSRRVTVAYSSEEQCIHQQTNILDTVGHVVTFPPGRHKFPFKIRLPLGLPSSFRHANGDVTYEVKADMARHYEKDWTVVASVTIMGFLDLSVPRIASVASQPIETSKYKSNCCFCCTKGSVGFILKMPRIGVAVGQFLEFSAQLMNNSRAQVIGVSACLIQELHFKAQGKSVQESLKILEAQGPAVQPGDSVTWAGQNVLRVPHFLPLSYQNCRIIDINYKFQIQMNLDGLSNALKKDVPIIIGTKPVRKSY